MKRIFLNSKMLLLIILVLGFTVFNLNIIPDFVKAITLPPDCRCSPWQDIGCGQGGCAFKEMYQARDCDPFGCDIQDRCVFDANCDCAGEGENPNNYDYGCCEGLEKCQYDNLCHSTCCIDNDNDGYGNPGRIDCARGSETDCDDNYNLINPGASEICLGGWDEDCDGKIDCFDSDCFNDVSCKVCDTADDCSQNPSCYRTRCISNTCVYDQYNCSANGVCCFPVCSYDPNASNYDSDCENYCPEFGTGTVTINFPPIPNIGLGSLKAQGDKNGLKAIGSRAFGNFYANVTNRWAGTINCNYPHFQRVFAIMSTSCIPKNATINSATFKFSIDSRSGSQPSSVWIDNSTYKDNNNNWIINPSNYPNNGVKINERSNLYYGNQLINVPSQYIKKDGNNTRFFLRFGNSIISDAKLADDVYDCDSRKPYSCGGHPSCACRWLNGRTPKCGRSDPCYWKSNLSDPCSGCPLSGYPSSQNSHGCYHSSWMSGIVSGTNPILQVTFYNPGTAPEINLDSPSSNLWVNYIPTFKAKIYDDDFPDENAKAYFEILSVPKESGWGDEININGAVSKYTPSSLADGEWWWRAYARDDAGNESAWTDSWLIKKDTVDPVAILDQENGVSSDTSVWVNLRETDDASGIAEGDVDVRINNGVWQDYISTISDFTYSAIDGNTYEFRYRVKDKAGNWSGFSYDGSVTIDLNNPPFVSCNDIETWNYCVDSRNPTISWIYSDPDNDPQESYQIQIDNNSDFSSPEIDTGEISNSGTSYHPTGTILNWSTTYYWQVKVKDDKGTWSEWSSPNCSFNTVKHAYPDVDFSWSPRKPSTNESVQFTDETEFYNGANNWFWTFENAVPASSVLQNPLATFSSPGNWEVKLEATDNDGYMCPITKTVDVNYPLPEWKEVIPN